jgi:hypothetical protein
MGGVFGHPSINLSNNIEGKLNIGGAVRGAFEHCAHCGPFAVCEASFCSARSMSKYIKYIWGDYKKHERYKIHTGLIVQKKSRV